jgi:hypothetical protein
LRPEIHRISLPPGTLWRLIAAARKCVEIRSNSNEIGASSWCQRATGQQSVIHSPKNIIHSVFPTTYVTSPRIFTPLKSSSADAWNTQSILW